MATRANGGYCATTDLLLGDMPLSKAIDAQKFVNDTADEIDIRVSRLYVVPIELSNLTRVATLVLKMTNARLASGRILMAQAQAAQDDSLNAYALHLIREAEATLDAIESARLTLEGALFRDDLTDTPGPTIRNEDRVPAVDAFYGEFLGGGSQRPLPVAPVWRPGR